MTKRETKERRFADALEEFRRDFGGISAIDLTPDGYMERMKEIRRADPTKARRVWRTLDRSLTDRVFSRRQVTWTETSLGRKARHVLLPHNPHFLKDADAIRAALGLSLITRDAFDAVTDASREAHELEPLSAVELAGIWVSMHRAKSRGWDSPQEFALTFPTLFASARAATKISWTTEGPDWMNRPPLGDAPYDSKASPFDWAVGRLLERYRLAWHAGSAIATFLLIGDVNTLKGLEVFAYLPWAGDEDGQPFSFTMTGIDEFTTNADLRTAWKYRVRPWQDELWRERGQDPQGKQATDMATIKRALPIYLYMVEKGETFALALGTLTKEVAKTSTQIPRLGHGNAELTTVSAASLKEAVSDLKALLSPKD